MAGPLEGLLVVALEQAVAAPFCTRRLADAGARVIKVERAEGDFARGYDHAVHGESAYFVWLNSGKESIVLDLKGAADARVLAAIIGSADVFVQNLAPGAAARAGFGSDLLRTCHPRLITCDISGFGSTGPMRDAKAYDLLIQCESGLASITGTPEAPGRVGISIADIACGTYAHAGILEALLTRAHTGKGIGIAVSLFDALADWMTVPLLQSSYGAAPQRVGLAHPSIVPYGVFRTADARDIVIAVQNEREWAELCRIVLGDPELARDIRFAGNSARTAHRTECEARVGARFAELPHAALESLLREANIAHGSVNGLKDLEAHPHLRRAAVDTPSGPVSVVATPVRGTGGEPPRAKVPALGEHGAALRREFNRQ
jgi:crotonobetainyl-CoA:carnitine CoA-transferase CaiB-like acyl-CoA transferase